MERYLFTSVTRIANFPEGEFDCRSLARDRWATGHYVVGEITDANSPYHVELPNGRMVPVVQGDRVVGALGVRAATLEATGDWQDMTDDGVMHLLTGAGLFGKLRAKAPFMPNLIAARYLGHVLVREEPVSMAQAAMEVPVLTYQTPTLLVIGTSMSAGKTIAATMLVRRLKAMGLRVVGAKLVGAARYRDTLRLADAGADAFYDFVDVGLPSTICPQPQFQAALTQLLSRLQTAAADMAVVELGASPMEPYNGAAAVEAIQNQIKMTVLCASDPYSVVGIMDAYGGVLPDLVTGPATNTDAGQNLILKLTGIQPLNLLEGSSIPVLDALLHQTLHS